MRAGRGRWVRGATWAGRVRVAWRRMRGGGAWCGRGVGRMRGGGVLHRMRAWGAAQDARRHDVSESLTSR